MAIGFDNSAVLGSTVASSQTVAYSVGAVSNPVIWVACANIQTGDNLTGITYGGQAMTVVTRFNATLVGSTNWIYLAYLFNAPTGSNNVVVSLSLSGTISSIAGSYSGAGAFDNKDSGSNVSATSISSSITSIADNSWMVMAGFTAGGINSGTGSVQRSGAGGNLGWYDNNGPIHPAGPNSMTISSSAPDLAEVAATFSPSGSGGFKSSPNTLTMGV